MPARLGALGAERSRKPNCGIRRAFFPVAGCPADTTFTVLPHREAEDYVKRKAWWDASAPACQYHPPGGCELVPHGSYARKFPDGARVRRFRRPQAGRTVSLLPTSLAAHWSTELVEVERAVRKEAAERVRKRLRQDYVGLVGHCAGCGEG